MLEVSLEEGADHTIVSPLLLQSLTLVFVKNNCGNGQAIFHCTQGYNALNNVSHTN